MKISLLEPLGISEEEIRHYKELLEKRGHHFTYYNTIAESTEELKRRSAGQDIVMIANHPYPEEVIRSADCLKLIAVAFTGIDHVGMKACREKGITVCNCAGYSDAAVSELAVGMAVSLYRNLEQCNVSARTQGTSAGLMGREISGKTVGIVGCGKIGSRTAKLFQAFGADILVYARHEKEEWKKEGFQFCDLDTLLQKSDIVSLHLPLNDETRGFIDREKLAKMKKESIFINCARGPIVDSRALAEALQKKEISGAAIDVFDMEPPLPKEYALCRTQNTLLTPHVGFLTQEAMVRRAKTEFANVEAFLDGRPQNVCK